MLSSVSGAADPVATASTHQAAVVTGAMLILVMGLSLALIPVVLMPVLRPVSEFLAYGYLVIRGAVETACYVVLAAGVLTLVTLGGLGGSDETWRGLGRVLVDSEAMATVLTVVFCLGAALFYIALFRSGIAPRWISGWGLVASRSTCRGVAGCVRCDRDGLDGADVAVHAAGAARDGAGGLDDRSRVSPGTSRLSKAGRGRLRRRAPARVGLRRRR